MASRLPVRFSGSARGAPGVRRASVAAFVGIAVLAGATIAAADPVRVGSKRDTEGVILGEICAATLRASDVEATYRGELSGGTRVLWAALQRGDIDLYPEYTGTLTSELLHDATLTTIEALRERLQTMGLDVTAPLGFEDNFGLGVREDRAKELGLAKMSDLRDHPSLRFGFTHELIERAEGWPGLKAKYGLPHDKPRGFEHELAYKAIAEGSVDVVDVYTTDAEIDVYHLMLLADDRQHFPRYQALVIHRSALDPRAISALKRLEGKVSREAMMKMNRRAKIDRTPENEVAAAFVREGLGLTPAGVDAAPSRWTEIGRRTIEHVGLVAASLALAIAFSLPLGILAQRRRRFGEALLGGLGIVQTIPSLALLVFLLPLFGVGAAPAIVALFLYSLLPIVRGTATGLKDIAPGLRESAEALGLSPWAQLRRVELPLASRSILSGIKTAAVINVGTATIGALIGAGGYGQAILVGIRKDDLTAILEGAIPAAALALIVQGVFEVLERRVVPRGLRLGQAK